MNLKQLREGAKELLAKEKEAHAKKKIEDEFISKSLADKDISVHSIRGMDVRVHGDENTIDAANKHLKSLGYKHTASTAPTEIGSYPSISTKRSGIIFTGD